MGKTSLSRSPGVGQRCEDTNKDPGLCSNFLENLVSEHLWLSQFAPRRSSQRRIYQGLFLVLLICVLLLGHLQVWLRAAGPAPTVGYIVISCWLANTILASCVIFGLRLAVSFLNCKSKCNHVNSLETGIIKHSAHKGTGTVYDQTTSTVCDEPRRNDLHGIDNEGFEGSLENLPISSANKEGALREMTIVEIISSMFGFQRKTYLENRSVEHIELKCLKPRYEESLHRDPVTMELTNKDKRLNRKYRTSCYHKLGALGETQTLDGPMRVDDCQGKSADEDIDIHSPIEDELAVKTVSNNTVNKSVSSDFTWETIRPQCKIRCVHCKDRDNEQKAEGNAQSGSKTQETLDIFDCIWAKLLSYLLDQSNSDPNKLADKINQDKMSDVHQTQITGFAKTLALRFMDVACKSLSKSSPEFVDNRAHDDIMHFLQHLILDSSKQSPLKPTPVAKLTTKSDSVLLQNEKCLNSLGQHIQEAVQRMTIRQAKTCLQNYASQMQSLEMPLTSPVCSSRPTTSQPDMYRTHSPEEGVVVMASEVVHTPALPSQSPEGCTVAAITEVVPTSAASGQSPGGNDMTGTLEVVSPIHAVSGRSSYDLLRRLSLCSLGFDTASIDADRLELTARSSLESLEEGDVRAAIEDAADKVQDQRWKHFASDLANKILVEAKEILKNSGALKYSSDVKGLVDYLLQLPKSDVTSECLPTLTEYISGALFTEVCHSRHLCDRLRTAVLTGQYIDTIITNAFLCAEHQLQVSCDTLADAEDWQINNNNSKVSPQAENLQILGFIMESMFCQLKLLATDEVGCGEEISNLRIQEEDIMSHLPDFAASDVGTQLLWHAVQSAYGKVRTQAGAQDISQMALHRGWVGQLGDHFLVGGSKVQDHLAVVELISDVLLRDSMATACEELAEELMYFMCAGSVEAAFNSRLQDLNQLAVDQAEHMAKNDRCKLLSSRFLLVISNFATALKTQMPPRPAAAMDSPTGVVPRGTTSWASGRSLQLTDSDPWMKQVTSSDGSEVEPLLNLTSGDLDEECVLGARNVKPTMETLPIMMANQSPKPGSHGMSHGSSVATSCYHICLRSILSLMLIAIPACITITALDASPLSQRDLSTWLVAVTCSLLVEALLIEPLMVFFKAVHVWRQNKYAQKGYKSIPKKGPWINPEIWPDSTAHQAKILANQ